MPPPPVEKPKTSIWPIALAAVLAIMVLVALSFLTMGFFALVVIIGGVVFGVAALHYLVWGWWLSDLLKDEAAEQRTAHDPSRPSDSPRLNDDR